MEKFEPWVSRNRLFASEKKTKKKKTGITFAAQIPVGLPSKILSYFRLQTVPGVELGFSCHFSGVLPPPTILVLPFLFPTLYVTFSNIFISLLSLFLVRERRRTRRTFFGLWSKIQVSCSVPESRTARHSPVPRSLGDTWRSICCMFFPCEPINPESLPSTMGLRVQRSGYYDRL